MEVEKSLVDGFLRGLHDGNLEPEYEQDAKRICSQLMRRFDLCTKQEKFKLLEVELYLHSVAHPDPFAHCHPMQLKFGKWYFHRANSKPTSGFKSGTFKGLDLAVGDAQQEIYGGILIRSMIDDVGIVTNGSSLCVERLLKSTNQHSVKALDDVLNSKTAFDSDSELFLTKSREESTGAIHSSSRVGLTFKKISFEMGRHYICRKYRFLSDPKVIKKGKPNLVFTMIAGGLDNQRIRNLTGLNLGVISKHRASFDRGNSASPTQFVGIDLKGAELGMLHGLLS